MPPQIGSALHSVLGHIRPTWSGQLLNIQSKDATGLKWVVFTDPEDFSLDQISIPLLAMPSPPSSFEFCEKAMKPDHIPFLRLDGSLSPPPMSLGDEPSPAGASGNSKSAEKEDEAGELDSGRCQDCSWRKELRGCPQPELGIFKINRSVNGGEQASVVAELRFLPRRKDDEAQVEQTWVHRPHPQVTATGVWESPSRRHYRLEALYITSAETLFPKKEVGG